MAGWCGRNSVRVFGVKTQVLRRVRWSDFAEGVTDAVTVDEFCHKFLKFLNFDVDGAKK